jgi:hypothetical protein
VTLRDSRVKLRALIFVTVLRNLAVQVTSFPVPVGAPALLIVVFHPQHSN